ncbi:MAG: HAD hydrolase-like protein [Oscillospiraceae bacterium]|nr:HAD hydrolase-like protein [Oscillospiraceae bacterium]
MRINIPDLGSFSEDCGLKRLAKCSDGRFEAGKDGVTGIYATGDGKVEFICWKDHTLAYVLSALGHPAYYPLKPVTPKGPVKAVLMDLDGTSVRSESFWIWIIEQTTASLLGDPSFHLSKEDEPFISGHSVSEHLQYCIDKYCPGQSLAAARDFYFQHTHREMAEIMEGRGKEDAFTPSHGLKEFLLALKEMNIKIGLVTSGLYEKAWPEILSAFRTLEMDCKPEDFYDSAISAGFPLRVGSVGTLGELSPKPHPWLYAETATVGLGIPESERCHIVGIEDSGAGVASIRLAGFSAIGFAGGNIDASGTHALCDAYCENFSEVLAIIKKLNAST